jgi:hypothetical protein
MGDMGDMGDMEDMGDRSCQPQREERVHHQQFTREEAPTLCHDD